MSWSVYNAHNLEDGLVADFDTNLSGLGTELGTGAYNMSEVLALPLFKPEVGDSSPGSQRSVPIKLDCSLTAATSPACKVAEETLTYLNQGQSYELKLKTLEDSPELQDKILKTVVRVMFQDKRLQYSEQELIEEWKKQHMGERILTIDLPLSYNIAKYSLCGDEINTIEYLWDPATPAGCFIQVHCISTEFTAKKHGGEKGVIFRIQVDNFLQSEDSEVHIYSASCQVKVFKPKGADRKHKTDREKMEKKADKHKYQPSYDCTVLLEQQNPVLKFPRTEAVCGAPSPFTMCTPVPPKQTPMQQPPSPSSFTSSNGFSPAPERSPLPLPQLNSHDTDNVISIDPLHPGASIEQTQEWLKHHRFGNVAKIFQNFAGADLLRLRKDDLIQILDAADGIRLNNALQERHVRPRLTLYVCQEQQQIYHAMYLDRPLVQDLLCKLATLYDIPPQRISKVLRQSPTGIQVLVSNEMVQNLQEESNFALQVLKDPDADTFTIVMK